MTSCHEIYSSLLLAIQAEFHTEQNKLSKQEYPHAFTGLEEQKRAWLKYGDGSLLQVLWMLDDRMPRDHGQSLMNFIVIIRIVYQYN